MDISGQSHYIQCCDNRYYLCLWEKSLIICKPNPATFNTHSDFIVSCRHGRKFKSCDPKKQPFRTSPSVFWALLLNCFVDIRRVVCISVSFCFA